MAEQPGQVKLFPQPYSEDMFRELERSLSPERMRTYLQAAGGDGERAARIYAWNTAVSAAFYASLQGLEVALRNAMHAQLASRFGVQWYDAEAAGMDSGGLARVARAKAELRRNRRDVEPSRMVAALSFGFWVSLLGHGGRIDDSGRRADYEMTLWRPALRGAFPHHAPLTRKQVHRPLDHLRLLRNRIAHHEPIFRRDLPRDHERVLEVTAWISPATKAWIERHSRTPDLLDVRRDGEIVRS